MCMYVCIHVSHVMYLVCVYVFSVCAVLFVCAGCSHQPDDNQVLSPGQPQRWWSNATCASTRCVQPLATDVYMDSVNIDHLTGQSLCRDAHPNTHLHHCFCLGSTSFCACIAAVYVLVTE